MNIFGLQFKEKIIKIILCILYFGNLFYIFFLARQRRGPTLPWDKRHLNLKPLKYKIDFFGSHLNLSNSESRAFYFELFGNIILFIPFAFFLVWVFHINSFRKIMVISLITTTLTELLQLIFSIGVADIDDIILNMLGTAIGILILKLLFKVKAISKYEKK